MATSKDYKKGINKANHLIRLAMRERDRRGYRENLGYDSEHRLTAYLQTLDLTYNEESTIIQYFYKGCAQI